jgi:urease accessory protein
MLVAGAYLGHRDDRAVADRLDDADPHRVVLDDTSRRRSRARTRTERGRDLGIVVARELADGDVLETESGDLVIVTLATVEALVIDFADAEVAATAALGLGHALGNRHWDLALRGEEALVPVTGSRKRIRSTVADHLPEGVALRFEQVPPTVFDDGGADHVHAADPASGHDPDDGHSHGRGDGGHAHSHTHGTDTSGEDTHD